MSMLTGPLRATSSLSTLHATIDIRKPKGDAKCSRGQITPRATKLLHVERGKEEIVINGERLWVYRYDAAERLPGRAAQRGRRAEQSQAPTLPLHPVDRSIVNGQHYVVTEVLFDLPLPPRFPRLHWQAFIEVNTCSVLYLRAMVDFATGSVYLTDPITATGDTTITACSASTILDPLRTDVALEGLIAATPQRRPAPMSWCCKPGVRAGGAERSADECRPPLATSPTLRQHRASPPSAPTTMSTSCLGLLKASATRRSRPFSRTRHSRCQ